MSTRIPPNDPSLSQEARERLRKIYEQAAQRLEEPLELPEGYYSQLLPRSIAVPPSQTSISGWVTTALQSITLLAIVACAFWLGQLSTTVSNTSQKLDKLNDGVVGISRDSLSNRLTTIEATLASIDKRLEASAQSPQKK